MKYKAIIFDLGRVLFDFDWQIALDCLEGRVKFSGQDVYDRIQTHKTHLQFELGKINSVDFFSRWIHDLAFDGSAVELMEIWNLIFKPIPQNLELFKQVATNSAALILSNTNPAHIHYLEEKFDIFKHSAVNLYSYEEGLRKPDPAFFRLACKRAACNPEEAVFIDDLAENVAGAEAVGMQAIHYTGQDLLALLL